MDKELERMWKETVMTNLKYCPDIFLDELRKMKTLSVSQLRFEPDTWMQVRSAAAAA